MKKRLIIMIVLLFIAGCGGNNPIRDFKKNINEGVNLWTSVNYEIVRDKQVINDFDKPDQPLETPIMVRIYVETINKGKQSAQSIEIKLIEPTPLSHKHSTGYGGVTNGVLNKGDTYEYYYTYTFANEEVLRAFIDKTAVIITWNENQVNNEIKVNLPSNPIQGSE